MKPNNSSAIPEYRWFESDGLFMAIDQSFGLSLAKLQLAAGLDGELPDLTDAMLLSDQDPLLQCVDAWCNHEFNWKPVRLDTVADKANASTDTDDSNNSNSNDDTGGTDGVAGNASDNESILVVKPLHQQTQLPKLTVTLSSLEGEKRAVLLAVPNDELANMPDLPEQWQSLVSLTRHSYLYEVVLQDKLMSAVELEKIKPGAFVLLTESFSQAWPIQLSASKGVAMSKDVSAVMSAHLQIANNTVRLLQYENSEAAVDTVLKRIDEECVENELVTDALIPESEAQAQEQTHAEPASEAELGSKSKAEEVRADSSCTTFEAAYPTLQVVLSNPVLINQLYVQSAWQSEHNVLVALPEALDGARVRLLYGDQEPISLEGQIMPLGEGFGVLLDDMSSTTNSQLD